MSQRELGAGMQYGQSYVAMVESGDRIGSPDFAAHCDKVFGTPGTFMRLWERESRRGRHPEWFLPYLDLEAKATHILDFSSYHILGMLQTERYAHELFRAAFPREAPSLTAERVQGRMRRREALEREAPPFLWVILDESCLRRAVGGAVVMREQLAYLLEVADYPHVTIQVLPFAAGATAAGESFTLLRFDDQRPALYTEARGMGRVVDSTEAVELGKEDYERLRADALSPALSLAEMHKAMEEMAR
ncbi:helix-turn-helix transcriptional regulator [Streptomyces sp. UNOC14_S4]|nr:helix-turn-helix transcriptional regulator [Streptomyces sp. UNOC14_S4]